jgi:hypothetical protein
MVGQYSNSPILPHSLPAKSTQPAPSKLKPPLRVSVADTGHFRQCNPPDMSTICAISNPHSSAEPRHSQTDPLPSSGSSGSVWKSRPKGRPWVNAEGYQAAGRPGQAESQRRPSRCASGRDEMQNKSRRHACPNGDQSTPQPVGINPERQCGQASQRGDFDGDQSHRRPSPCGAFPYHRNMRPRGALPVAYWNVFSGCTVRRMATSLVPSKTSST